MDQSTRLALKKPTLTGGGALDVSQLRTAIGDHAVKLDGAVLAYAMNRADRIALGAAAFPAECTVREADTGDTWASTGSAWRLVSATGYVTRKSSSVQVITADGNPHNIAASSVIEESVPSIFTATASGSGTILTPVVPGRYFAVVRLEVSASTGILSLRKVTPGSGDTVLDHVNYSTGDSPSDQARKLTGDVRVAANESLFLQYSSTSGNGTVEVIEFTIYRMRG